MTLGRKALVQHIHSAIDRVSRLAISMRAPYRDSGGSITLNLTSHMVTWSSELPMSETLTGPGAL